MGGLVIVIVTGALTDGMLVGVVVKINMAVEGSRFQVVDAAADDTTDVWLGQELRKGHKTGGHQQE
ncbi:hypothetical protein BR93DRAFT_926247 [Coniochaeta sp. PMI_546]|nr:hypothetical protein BR93DRAFT_926247 [Coniochaeta sp. PMI_546]